MDKGAGWILAENIWKRLYGVDEKKSEQIGRTFMAR